MTGPFAVEPLAKGHERSAFRSEVDALDRYFREQVTQDVRRRVTNCFVALDSAGTVAGATRLRRRAFP
jgi:hypothetical protein